MAIWANRTYNGVLSPPLGWPVRLRSGQDTMIWGVVDKTATSVSATVQASKSATVYLAVYNTPATSGGADNGLVQDFDADGVTVKTSYQTVATLGSTETTVTLTLPSVSTHVAKPYVIRLWVTDIAGDSADTVARDASITDTTTQPRIPGYVDVSQIVVT